MADIGTLNAKITADANGFVKETGRAQRSAQSFTQKTQQQFQSLGKSVTALRGAVGGLVAAFASRAMVRAISQSLDNLDAIGKRAEQVGMGTTALQELTHAAGQMGVKSDELDKSLIRLNKATGEALRGNKLYTDSFKQLGVPLADTNGNLRDSSEIFDDVVKALGKIPDVATRTALSQELLGRGGIKMATMMAEGTAEIEKLREEAHKMGLVFDEDLVAKATKAKDTLELFKKMIGAQFTMLVADNITQIQDLANTFVELTQALGEFLKKRREAKGDFSNITSRDEIAARMGALRQRAPNIEQEALEAGQWSPTRTLAERMTRRSGFASDVQEFHDLQSRDMQIQIEDRWAERGLKPDGTPLPKKPSGSGTKVVDPAEAAAQKEAERIAKLATGYEQAVDPAARFRAELAQLDEVYAKSGMTADVYMENVAKLHEQIDAATETTDDYEEALADLAETMLAALNPYHEIEQAEERIKLMRDEGIISLQEYAQLEEDLANKREQIAASFVDTVDHMERMKELVEESGMAFASAFEDAIIQGGKLSGVIDGLIQDLTRLALRAMVTEPLVGALSSIGASFFGPGGKAGGGAFSGVELVGERGPELVMSNAPLRVLNNHMTRQGGMGGGIGAVKVEIVNRGTPVESISSQATMSPQGMVVSVITDDLRRGGPISAGMSQLYGLQRRR